MAGTVEIILSDTPEARELGADGRGLCERAVRETLRLEAERLGQLAGRDRAAEVSLTLLGDAGIRELNLRYLGRDKATDVLSFFMGVDEGDEPFLLGDVIVSVETVKTQAADWERPFPEELARVVSHGVLHLLGYTDEDDTTAAAMHDREDAVLRALGFEPGR